MNTKPEITKIVKEVNTCACGSTCYYQAVCSSCQVGMLLDIDDHKTWNFGFVAMWAKRLYRNVRQEVKILDAHLVNVRPLFDEYSISIYFIDGSKTERYASYWNHLTLEQAKRLLVKLNEDDISLNGLYWASI